MTRIFFLPNENAFYTLDSQLPPEKLVLAVNSGRWLPPAGLTTPEPADTGQMRLNAVRLGQSTILIFCAVDLDQIQSGQLTKSPLSKRQIAILQCLAQGMTTRQIAAKFGIARRTVYLHLAAIRRSLRAISTSEAVSRAAELGLCQPLISGRSKKRNG